LQLPLASSAHQHHDPQLGAAIRGQKIKKSQATVSASTLQVVGGAEKLKSSKDFHKEYMKLLN